MTRRAITIALALMVVLPLTQPVPPAWARAEQGSPVKVYRGTFQAAEATWLVRARSAVYIYYVMGYRMEKPLGTSKTFVFAQRSRCRMHGPKRRLASCSFGGRERKVRPRALRFDPALGGARLRYQDHRLSWVGGEVQDPVVDPWVDPEYAETEAYLERLSSVRGKLFGTRMKERRLDHAALSFGLTAGVAVSGDRLPLVPRSVTVQLPRRF